MSKDLAKFRAEIDALDERLLELLVRVHLAIQIRQDGVAVVPLGLQRLYGLLRFGQLIGQILKEQFIVHCRSSF